MMCSLGESQSLSASLQSGIRFFLHPLPSESSPLITRWIPPLLAGLIGLTLLIERNHSSRISTGTRWKSSMNKVSVSNPAGVRRLYIAYGYRRLQHHRRSILPAHLLVTACQPFRCLPFTGRNNNASQSLTFFISPRHTSKLGYQMMSVVSGASHDRLPTRTSR